MIVAKIKTLMAHHIGLCRFDGRQILPEGPARVAIHRLAAHLEGWYPANG
ncbi:MAG: hypothetical protein ACSHXD_10845 [Marinosulfonomonas sp.]